MERGDYSPVGGSTRSPEEVWTEWGVDQGEVQATQPDSGWKTEMLGGILHRIGGEVAVGSGSVGEGSLAIEGEDGPPAGGRWGVAGIREGQGGWAGKGPVRGRGSPRCHGNERAWGMSLRYGRGDGVGP